MMLLERITEDGIWKWVEDADIIQDTVAECV